jgi:hypothetical protein
LQAKNAVRPENPTEIYGIKIDDNGVATNLNNMQTFIPSQSTPSKGSISNENIVATDTTREP